MVNKIRFFQSISLCVLGVLFLSFQAQAGVGLSQTRVIINEKDNVSSINARNNSSQPYLVSNYMTEKLDSPTPLKGIFIVTPNLFKLAPNSENTIKIQILPSTLPKDRESLYYFHSRNIPATSEGDDGVKIAMENVIKVLYRPERLPMSSKEAGDKLVVASTLNGVSIENPTPYYINLFKITVNNESIKLDKKNNIIAPFSSMTYSSINKSGAVNIHIINDLGGESVYKKNIQ